MASATYLYPYSYHRRSSHLVTPNPLYDAAEAIRHYRNEDPIVRFDATGAPIQASCARIVVGNDEMQTPTDSQRYSALPHHRFHPQRVYGVNTTIYTNQPVISDEFCGSAAELQQHRENPRYCGRSPASFSNESFGFAMAHQQHRGIPQQFAYTQHKMVTISIPLITAFQQPPPSSTSFSKFQFWAQLCQIKEGKGGKIRRAHFWRNNKKKPYNRPSCTTANDEGISDLCFLDLGLEISRSRFTSHTMEKNKLFTASFINGERVVSVSEKTDLTSYVSHVEAGITEDDNPVGGTIGNQEADECALTAFKLFDDTPLRNVSVEQFDVHKQLGGWLLLQSEEIRQQLSSLAHSGEGDESGDYGDMLRTRRRGIGVVWVANGVNYGGFRRTGIGVVCDANGVGCDMFRRTGIGVVCDAIRLNGDKFSRTGVGVVCDVNGDKFDMLRRTRIGVKALDLVSEFGGLDCVEELDVKLGEAVDLGLSGFGSVKFGLGERVVLKVCDFVKKLVCGSAEAESFAGTVQQKHEMLVEVIPDQKLIANKGFSELYFTEKNQLHFCFLDLQFQLSKAYDI